MNGPSVTAQGERAAVAWFTQAGEVPRVKVAWSSDRGRSFGPPLILQRGATLGRVDVVPWGDSPHDLLVSHVTRVGRDYRLLVSAVQDGRVGATIHVADLSGSRADGFPQMALVGRAEGEALVAWTAEGDGGARIQVARLH